MDVGSRQKDFKSGLNKMGKDKQEFLAMGELTVFLLAWLLGITVALRGDPLHSSPGNDIAATGGYSQVSEVLE
ncbi:MAG: hypothetical protein KDA57_02585 [Planctomycetales bacterium]|nr:hypothetical protein [Planctomycetales bacterium]